MLKSIFHLLLILFGVGISAQSFAIAKAVCVRTYNTEQFNPCSLGTGQFVSVVSDDSKRSFLCTRVQADRNCKQHKTEFSHALGEDGRVVCVLNFNQTATGNYCASQPESYAYAKDPWS